ncbi:MAG: hypothetical protein ABIH42_05835 [Planctomycetota bacterium]
MRKSAVFLILVTIFVILNSILLALKHLPFNAQGMGIIVAAGLTLAIYSFLYKDNPAFKLAEHLYIGIAIGYNIVVNYFSILKPNLIDQLFKSKDEPNYWLIIPLILGILMFSRFIPKLLWISRWTIAFIVGWGAGVAIPRAITENILEQARSSFTPVYGPEGFSLANITAVICLIGVLSVLFYFFFSIEHKGAAGKLSRLGIWFLMISFGAAFGFTLMGRMALLIDRIAFLLGDWLKLIS